MPGKLCPVPDPRRPPEPRPTAADLADLAAVNTAHLVALIRAADGYAREEVAHAWVGAAQKLVRRNGPSTLALLGLAVAQAHAQVAAGAREPVPLHINGALVMTESAAATGPTPAPTVSLPGGTP